MAGKTLIIDGVKFNLVVPKDEKQLEEMVKEHAKEIFGEDAIYFDIKQKIISKSEKLSGLWNQTAELLREEGFASVDHPEEIL